MITVNTFGTFHFFSNLMCLKVFKEFQCLVERQFDRKIKVMQTDWGGAYKNINTYVWSTGIHHHRPCPYPHE